MKCSNCDVTLKKDHICPRCGTDYSLYIRIQETSNEYYNAGLLKAQARDLSGAAESLKVSLQMNKKNIPARNLLGLVYYEMGDLDLAVKEWQISRLLKFRNNAAEQYLADVFADTDSVNSYNNSIQKFNLALETIQQDRNLDMGIVQLKKVINLNPRLLKAYQLLALVYIQTKQYAKAVGVLNRCLEVDRGNTCARAYLNDLQIRGLIQDSKERLKAGEKAKADVVIPTKVRDVGSYLINALYILAGAALALGIFWYAMVPEIRGEYESVSKYTASEYEGKIAELNRKVAELNENIAEQETLIAKLEQSANDAESDYQQNASDSAEELNGYNRLLEVLTLFVDHDYLGVSDAFKEVSKRASKAEAYRDAYEAVENNLASDLNLELLVWANYYRDSRQFELAVPYFDGLIERAADPYSLYWGAICHHETGEKEEAIAYLVRIGEEFVETDYFEMAMDQLAAIQGKNADVLKAQYRQQWQERQALPGSDDEENE